MIAHADEIRHLDAGAELRVAAQARDQEAGGAFQCGVGQAQMRQIEDRHIHDPQLGILEIELALDLVVDHPAGADLPERRRVG